MRLPGWCEKCHKVRQVRVRVPIQGRIQVGICAACEEKQSK